MWFPSRVSCSRFDGGELCPRLAIIASTAGRSGLVVAAEELGLFPAGQANDLLLDVLARTNHFSMEDLQINRDGSLRGHQEVRLLGFVFFWVVLLFAFIFISFLALQNQLAGENKLVYILLILVAEYVFIRIGWRSMGVLRDIWDGKVESAHGHVTRHIRRARNSHYYIYKLGDFKFNVSMSAYNALIEDKEYLVYFTPRTKRLVAIEPLA